MSSNIQSFKSKVERAFSKHAGTYDKHAGLQTLAAESCADLLCSLKNEIPEGELLEIGCGTGIFSSKFRKLFPDRKIIFSDISAEMLTACRLRLNSEKREQHSFELFDAEELEPREQFAAIASSFAIQWFYQPLQGLARLLAALKPEGILVLTFPGEQSCPEWRKAASNLQIPFTFNQMPETAQMNELAAELGLEFQYQEAIIEDHFDSALSMLRSIKELGAGTQRNELQLTSKQLRLLIAELEKNSLPVKCSYQLVTAHFRKAAK